MLASLIRRLFSAALHLPPRTNEVASEKGLVMHTRDGVALIADRYFPADGRPRATVLTRTPYGRGALMTFSASLMAERGLNVIVQSVRGTAGSEGQFDPGRQERADGIDTVDWVRAQPWFNGKLFLFGGSYLGWTAWAIAAERPQHVDGIALTVTMSDFRDEMIEYGGLPQFSMLGWTAQMEAATRTGVSPVFGGGTVTPEQHLHLPLGTIDKAVTGSTVPWWQDWIAHRDREDPWWQGSNFSAGVTAAAAPTWLLAGWRDLFLPYQIKDFEARQAAGLPTWITIGPWDHGGPGGLFEGNRQSMVFLAGLADGGNAFADRAPVRLYVQGANEWREYSSWPPPHVAPLELHLREGGRLTLEAPTGPEAPARYTYDPADPTPHVYGATTQPPKSRDMSPLLARQDVAAFTSDDLAEPLEIIGPVTLNLAIRSNREHTDFYAALCEVDYKGRPIHVTDGYLRLEPNAPAADKNGVRNITIDCWPTAHRFLKGAKVMLIVASGSFPRWSRNLGTGEPMATATGMVTAEQEILLGAESGAVVRVMRS